MKIERLENKRTYFKDLKKGVIFEWENEMFMKVGPSIGKSQWNAASIEDGTLYSFHSSTLVFKTKGKFVEEE